MYVDVSHGGGALPTTRQIFYEIYIRYVKIRIVFDRVGIFLEDFSQYIGRLIVVGKVSLITIHLWFIQFVEESESAHPTTKFVQKGLETPGVALGVKFFGKISHGFILNDLYY